MTLDGARVLFATSWYPAFDQPGRASFVADQAVALVRSGMHVEVASWEAATRYRAYDVVGEAVAERAAEEAWCAAVRERGSSVALRSWGAPGVLTSRLPVAAPRVAAAPADARVVAAAAAHTLLAWADNPCFRVPAIVHAHVGLPDGVAAMALAERLGVPLITTEHDSTTDARLALPGMREAYLPLLEGRHALLAVSESFRMRLATALEVDPARIGVVPNVVDVGAFSGDVGRAARDEAELLWVGNRKAPKGTDVLLAAFARLRRSRPELRLRLIGRAPSEVEEQRLRALAHDLGVLDAVAFEGQADRAVVAAAMARAAVFVHPSPSETFGVVAAEALAAGLPVAARPSGGVEEIVGRDGRFGEIADDASPEALAAAVERALDHHGRFDAGLMRASVIERYGSEAVAGQLRARYAELLERGVERTRPAAPVAAEPRHRVGAEVPGREPRDRSEPLPLVVAMQRGRAAARLAAVPLDLARGLVVITTVAPDGRGTELPVGPRWIELDPDHAYGKARVAIVGRRGSRRGVRRILRLLRHPMSRVRLRRLAAERPMLRPASLRTDLGSVLGAIRPPAGIEIVALAADDAELVLPLLDDRVRLAPWTLRGLVDRWDAAGRPVVPALELSAATTGDDPEPGGSVWILGAT